MEAIFQISSKMMGFRLDSPTYDFGVPFSLSIGMYLNSYV